MPTQHAAAPVRQIDRPEAKRLMARMLKNTFPGFKFSLRQNHRGLVVDYENGPALSSVERICEIFQGEEWDGMEDLSRPVDTEFCGEMVHFQVSSVSVNRHFTPDTLQQILARIQNDLPDLLPTLPTIHVGEKYAWFSNDLDHYRYKEVGRLVQMVDEREMDTLGFTIRGGRYWIESAHTRLTEFFLASATYALEQMKEAEPERMRHLIGESYGRPGRYDYIFGRIYDLWLKEEAQEVEPEPRGQVLQFRPRDQK